MEMPAGAPLAPLPSPYPDANLTPAHNEGGDAPLSLQDRMIVTFFGIAVYAQQEHTYPVASDPCHTSVVVDTLIGGLIVT